MKSGWILLDFTGEIHKISGWNLVDFNEILGHSPHPAFIKLKSFCWNTCFYNFGWISQVKSGWNLPDFTGEIHQISGWNPLDFKGEIPHPAFIKLKSFCWNTCFYNFGWISQMISGWNPPDFTGEIRRISKDQLPGMVSPMFELLTIWSNWCVYLVNQLVKNAQSAPQSTTLFPGYIPLTDKTQLLIHSSHNSTKNLGQIMRCWLQTDSRTTNTCKPEISLFLWHRPNDKCWCLKFNKKRIDDG